MADGAPTTDINGTSSSPDLTVIDVYEIDLTCGDNQGATYVGQTTVTSNAWNLSGAFNTSSYYVALTTEATNGISEFSQVSNPYTVTNTNDSGIGSLRWAIENANLNASQTIDFNIAGVGPWIISLLC